MVKRRLTLLVVALAVTAGNSDSPEAQVVAWGGPSVISKQGVKSAFSNDEGLGVVTNEGQVVLWPVSYPYDFDIGPTDVVQSVFVTASAFAALTQTRRVITWGNRYSGGNSDSVDFESRGPVRTIIPNPGAFVAIFEDGSLAGWGDDNYGGYTPLQLLSSSTSSNGVKVQTVFATRRGTFARGAFAALMENGSVVTWGDTDAGGDSSGLNFASKGGVTTIVSTSEAFAALKKDGSVLTWGVPSSGGDSQSVNFASGGGVVSLFSTQLAFAALKNDGSIVCWGEKGFGGACEGIDLMSVGATTIVSTPKSFAARMKDKTVRAWGDTTAGGSIQGVDFDAGGGVEFIFASTGAFATINSDGSVTCWGDSHRGGDCTSIDLSSGQGIKSIVPGPSGFAAFRKSNNHIIIWGSNQGVFTSDRPVKSLFPTENEFAVLFQDESLELSSVTPFPSEIKVGEVDNLFSTQSENDLDAAFAVLKRDGSVVTWGRTYNGGDSSGVDLTSDVKLIQTSCCAFAALKTDGSVVTWGPINSTQVNFSSGGGVKALFSNKLAFAALKSDGTVVSWGNEFFGGSSDSFDFASGGGVKAVFSIQDGFAALKVDGSVISWGAFSDSQTNVQTIYTNCCAFVALKRDGSVVAWGTSEFGADTKGVDFASGGGVKQIVSTQAAFAAQKHDGSVVAWGKDSWGGDAGDLDLTSISKLYSTMYAFAALKTNGRVITWGGVFDGGDSASVDLTDVAEIYSTRRAFAALKSDGSVVAWGLKMHGGDASTVDVSSGVETLYATDWAFLAKKVDGSAVAWGHPGFGGDLKQPILSRLSLTKVWASSTGFVAEGDSTSSPTSFPTLSPTPPTRFPTSSPSSPTSAPSQSPTNSPIVLRTDSPSISPTPVTSSSGVVEKSSSSSLVAILIPSGAAVGLLLAALACFRLRPSFCFGSSSTTRDSGDGSHPPLVHLVQRRSFNSKRQRNDPSDMNGDSDSEDILVAQAVSMQDIPIARAIP